MPQLLLLPDARPLDERLGRQFFREAPRRPGVYLMRDAAGQVLYVGKAKDLKQRLNHYRVANPDRMPRRHLRLVREVRHIEFQFCENESAALAQEANLLRSLKPNRPLRTNSRNRRDNTDNSSRYCRVGLPSGASPRRNWTGSPDNQQRVRP